MVLVSVFAASAALAGPMTNAFTYQGMLKDAGVAANDDYDFQFKLYDAAALGTQKGVTINVNNKTVTDGLFTVELDFTEAIFDGVERWLQIGVRPWDSGGAYTVLPRQKITPAPVAKNLLLPFEATTDATGNLLDITRSAGSGRIGRFVNNSAGGYHSLRIESNDSAAALGVYGNGTATEGIYSSSANESAGQFYGTGAANANAAVYAHTAGTGAAAHVDGPLDVGSTGTAGSVDVFRNGVANAVVSLTSDAYGGLVRTYDPNGTLVSEIGVDSDGGGVAGDLRLRGGGGAFSAYMSGDWAGSANAWLQLLGASRDIILNTDSVGDDSVRFPTNAISRGEIEDEPGVASINSETSLALSGAVENILSRTITVPASGYVLAIGTVDCNLSHTTGSSSFMYFGVSDVSATFKATNQFTAWISSNAPSGIYYVPGTAQAIFDVSAGANTFYFVADEAGGSWTVTERQLSLVYFPTAYGTYDPPLPGNPREPMPAGMSELDWNNQIVADARGALTADEIAAEQAEAHEFDMQRVQREMAEMRAEMAQLRALVRQEIGQRASQPTPAPAPRMPEVEADAAAE
jgi:hypothetical protein